MADIYSTRFAASYAYQGWKYYTVPAGHVAVVKAISVLSNDAPAASIFGVDINGMWAYYWSSPGVGQSRHDEVRWTVYAGEKMGFYTSVGLVAYQVNGFLFAASTAAAAGALLEEGDGVVPPAAGAVSWPR